MEDGKGRSVWVVVLVISLLFTEWTILQNGLTMWAGSSFDVGTVEEKARGFMNMAMIKPLWEELWIGIIGIFRAIGLRRGMLLANGIVQGASEMADLGRSTPCPQTFVVLVVGIVTPIALLLSSRRFSPSGTRT